MMQPRRPEIDVEASAACGGAVTNCRMKRTERGVSVFAEGSQHPGTFEVFRLLLSRQQFWKFTVSPQASSSSSSSSTSSNKSNRSCRSCNSQEPIVKVERAAAARARKLEDDKVDECKKYKKWQCGLVDTKKCAGAWVNNKL
ncbi:unnamed protein product [Ceratitis capitata]|uniref:(Mediterranean fruit fly) hypothetical protein n=1 Tax=Ceratitis capitata TaxID=7213 RepID=A0A811VHG6_CERCA|nr:unnamed protein product [Ceratitis capitata]